MALYRRRKQRVASSASAMADRAVSLPPTADYRQQSQRNWWSFWGARGSRPAVGSYLMDAQPEHVILFLIVLLITTTSPTVATAVVRGANCTEESLAGGEWNGELKCILIIIPLTISFLIILLVIKFRWCAPLGGRNSKLTTAASGGAIQCRRYVVSGFPRNLRTREDTTNLI